MTPTMTTSNALLASLAIIKANWDVSQESYVDNFLPFFLDAAKEAAGAPLSALAAKTHIRERFGIDIPEGVLSTLSRRAAQKKLGHRENGSFVADRSQLDGIRDLGRQKADHLRRQTALVSQLINFAEERFQRTLSIEEAEDALLDHIEAHSVPLLGSVVNGAPYDARPSSSSDKTTEYIVNAFVGHVVSSMPDAFEHLEAVVKGSMLAVSLYLPNGSELGRRIDRTTFYLDAPVLLKALGYEGQDAMEAAKDLIILSRDAGANLACFEHSVSEVRGILQRSASKASQGAFHGSNRRATDSHFASMGVTASDILLMSQRLDDDINALGVAIQERPDPSPALTIDELALEDLMGESMGYSSRDALLNDLDSLTAVHRLRGGRSSSRLETCRALLVTTNAGLARVGRSFFMRGGDHEWPPALTDHHLATLVWLKKPQAAPNLPRAQILADCFAALEPGGRIWDRYLGEIQRLSHTGEISESDVMLLRYSTEAERSLMDRTMGDADRVTSTTVADILETVKAEILSPAEGERDAAVIAVSTIRNELEGTTQALEAREGELAEERAAKQAAGEHAESLESRLAQLETADQNRRQRATKKAQRRALTIHRCFIGVCAGIILFSIAATVLPDGIIPGWAKPAAPWTISFSVVASGLTLFLGGSIWGTAGWLRRQVEHRLEKRYLAQVGD
ncbi:hypothetical protein ACIQC5_13175 [Paenarthrobacter sp. NPDC092416]|uniref:hypothetical protein n=1 Tax=Paenarthrobacter sp. NPDC092416 TaxID=3364386 RepID=UPI0038068918